MSYLADTNIFLEILLRQAAKEKCKRFLQENLGELSISDFSLHSIGVRLFRQNSLEVFRDFVNDSLPNLEIIGLSDNKYEDVITAHLNFRLDFDDAYQFCVAQEKGLAIATQDQDFDRVKNEITIRFI
ncbi:MAG: PIN domain-containing protein [Verrucomicrobiota bacterium]